VLLKTLEPQFDGFTRAGHIMSNDLEADVSS
jgi:hypothetical protein